MYTKDNTFITGESIFRLLDSLESETYSPNDGGLLLDFVSFWRQLAKVYSTKLVMYFDSNKSNDDTEMYTYTKNVEEQEFNIHFDIARIKSAIKNGKIDYTKVSENSIIGEYQFTQEYIRDVSLLKSSNPIIVPFPTFKDDGSLIKYIVIDGNNRVTNYCNNSYQFDFDCIDNLALLPQYFCDQNSWIMYHLFISYTYLFIMGFPLISKFQFFQTVKQIVNNANKSIC